MKYILYILLILSFFSCLNHSYDKKGYKIIDPCKFLDSEIFLSNIASDISYIPLDNNFPIGQIFSYKIINGSIYASIKDVGIVRYNSKGKFVAQYGKIGRGPGEYIHYFSFTVDKKNGHVYVLDPKIDDIEVFDSKGKYIRNFKLPVDKEGFGLNEVEFLDSYLFLSQYINLGKGRYNWIILDTLGNKISEKYNPYPIFKGRLGSQGKIFTIGDNLGYWDSLKDTVFKISTDLSYNVHCVFEKGEHRLPLNTEQYTPKNFYPKLGVDYVWPKLFFETNNFFYYEYGFKKEKKLALIYKNNSEVKSTTIEKENGGIQNDIDHGLSFIPENYYIDNNEEYLLSFIQPYELIRYSNVLTSPKNTRTSGMRNDLFKLLKNINENDNPVLMLVKLKE